MQPAAAHLRRVVGEPEIGPVQLHRARPLAADLADGEGVVDLLEHEAREDGEDLELDAVAELVHRVEQARVGEAVVRVLRADALVAVGGAARVVGPVDGVAGVVAAVRAHQHAAALGEARDPEGAEEGVEQARVVGVLDVLHVELPVVRQGLREAAQHLDASLCSTRRSRPSTSSPRYSSMGGVSGDSVAKTSPASTVVRSLRGPWSALQKDAGMPPRPLLPFSKAMPTRLPAQVVGPRVVDALEVLPRRRRRPARSGRRGGRSGSRRRASRRSRRAPTITGISPTNLVR